MILDEISERTRIRIREKEKAVPLEKIKAEAMLCRQQELTDKADGREVYPDDFPFFRALSGKDLSFICEVKKASPSKGTIAEDFPYLKIAEEYEEAGAAAISCLTEPYYFKGKDRYLSEIASSVHIPVLRKDFTISPYMIYEVKVLGASAVLLICAILSDRELAEGLAAARSLGLSALVEAHTEEEVRRAAAAGARIIGVNNRNLRNFEVDTKTAAALRPLVPENILFVAESGITSPQDVKRLKEAGVDAVLVGEALMRAADKKEKLLWLSSG